MHKSENEHFIVERTMQGSRLYVVTPYVAGDLRQLVLQEAAAYVEKLDAQIRIARRLEDRALASAFCSRLERLRGCTALAIASAATVVAIANGARGRIHVVEAPMARQAPSRQAAAVIEHHLGRHEKWLGRSKDALADAALAASALWTPARVASA